MDILGIETSSPRGSVALWRDGRPVVVKECVSDRAHNSVLFAPLKSVLQEAREIKIIVVGTGPGSYTGVRVGIAAAMGISLACGAPLIGVPSICALSDTAGLERYAVCGNARRGAWWWAEVCGGTLTRAPVAGSLADCAGRADAWNGRIFTVDEVTPPFCQATVVVPGAERLTSAAAVLSETAVAAFSAASPEPIYLSAPFVTVSKKPVFA